ncbi:hypothetical protein BD410DRAFT_889782 [Rickenella mellea]|uniref:Uncharacterized protein n=1 Tax=Rickenella mellea TaxID=50990 RepID=A0A4Y7PNA7_9AGAM|nr:hypothetical protein BD410DRAFT_889782 [Rickenella mellea]
MANTTPVDDGVERHLVLSIVSILFVIGYGFVLLRYSWQWFPLIMVLHLLSAAATEKRFPSADTSAAIHFIAYMLCVLITTLNYVTRAFSGNLLDGIFCVLLVPGVIVIGEMFFVAVLEFLGSPWAYGQFRKQHGPLGVYAASRFVRSVWIAIKEPFLYPVQGRTAPTEASIFPPPTL